MAEESRALSTHQRCPDRRRASIWSSLKMEMRRLDLVTQAEASRYHCHPRDCPRSRLTSVSIMVMGIMPAEKTRSLPGDACAEVMMVSCSHHRDGCGIHYFLRSLSGLHSFPHNYLQHAVDLNLFSSRKFFKDSFVSSYRPPQQHLRMMRKGISFYTCTSHSLSLPLLPLSSIRSRCYLDVRRLKTGSAFKYFIRTFLIRLRRMP